MGVGKFCHGCRGMRLKRRRIFCFLGSRNCNCSSSSSSAHNDYAHNGNTKNHNNPNHHSNYQRKLCFVARKVVSFISINVIGDHNCFTLAFFQVLGAFTINLTVFIAISEPIGKFIKYLCISSLNGLMKCR